LKESTVSNSSLKSKFADVFHSEIEVGKGVHPKMFLGVRNHFARRINAEHTRAWQPARDGSRDPAVSAAKVHHSLRILQIKRRKYFRRHGLLQCRNFLVAKSIPFCHYVPPASG
jgi:hypothetical protein